MGLDSREIWQLVQDVKIAVCDHLKTIGDDTCHCHGLPHTCEPTDETSCHSFLGSVFSRSGAVLCISRHEWR